MKFEWKPDKDPCCHYLYVDGKHFGLVCANGRGAWEGMPVYVSGNIFNRKKQFEEFAEIKIKVQKYEERLWSKREGRGSK